MWSYCSLRVILGDHLSLSQPTDMLIPESFSSLISIYLVSFICQNILVMENTETRNIAPDFVGHCVVKCTICCLICIRVCIRRHMKNRKFNSVQSRLFCQVSKNVHFNWLKHLRATAFLFFPFLKSFYKNIISSMLQGYWKDSVLILFCIITFRPCFYNTPWAWMEIWYNFWFSLLDMYQQKP